MKIALQAATGHHPSAKPGAAAGARRQPGGACRGAAGHHRPLGRGQNHAAAPDGLCAATHGGHRAAGRQDPWRLRRRALQGLRKALFLAPQVPPLPPRQRVVTAVLAGRLPHESLWASLRSLFYPQDIALAHQVLAAFDLSDKLFERVDRISGGERQRVGLARALVSQASLWLVDEPLSALDPSRARQALGALTGAARTRGATLVATLHHVEMALAHFPRIVGLRDGTVAFDLSAAEVTPAHLQALYAQHLHELTGPAAAPAPEDFPSGPAPVVMHCR
jgi:phosphonate transport system ATP-binding protein